MAGKQLNPRAPKSALSRFWSKVNKTDTCWLWTGYPLNRYGQFTVDNKTVKAHRFSYITFKGPIPKNVNVCHTCDTALCVNPEHLFLGTQSDNVKDMHKKGRANKALGSKAGRSRLTADQVLEIRAMAGQTNYRIAALYGVTPNAIRFIKLRLSWRHI